MGGLGRVIYIPAVSRLEDQVKLTGPSPFRDLVGLVLGSSVGMTDAFGMLRLAFTQFEGQLRRETQGGRSLVTLEKEISEELGAWQSSFEISVNQIEPAELVKSLVRLYVRDPHSGDSIDPDQLGSGQQRSLIFALLKLSSRYRAAAGVGGRSTRGGSPLTLTWLLFEEPETFLHPMQIDSQHRSLMDIGKSENHQVIVTTHNPAFLSRSVEDLSSLVRIYRHNADTRARQISQEDLSRILDANQEANARWKNANIEVDTDDLNVDMESIKYSLWLNPQRAAAFFARKVVIAEGPTEVAVLNYLMDRGDLEIDEGGLFVLDAMGKYNIHRFMNLFGTLGIHHSVIYDEDSHPQKAATVKGVLEDSRNSFTLGMHAFTPDLERFLKIDPCKLKHRKPQHALYRIRRGMVPPERLADLSEIVRQIIVQ